MTAVEYRPDGPGATRLHMAGGDRARAALLVAGPQRVDEVTVDGVRDR